MTAVINREGLNNRLAELLVEQAKLEAKIEETRNWLAAIDRADVAVESPGPAATSAPRRKRTPQ